MSESLPESIPFNQRVHQVFSDARPKPRDLSPCGQNDGSQRRPETGPPPAIPAAESALGLRPRRALSSAQVLPEWTTSTPPCNDVSANGDSPLNLLSHQRGSPHLTIGFADESGKQQGAVLEIAKGRVTSVLNTLETRSGKQVEYESEEAKKHAGN